VRALRSVLTESFFLPLTSSTIAKCGPLA
jgi:hypothetical protein